MHKDHKILESPEWQGTDKDHLVQVRALHGTPQESHPSWWVDLLTHLPSSFPALNIQKDDYC